MGEAEGHAVKESSGSSPHAGLLSWRDFVSISAESGIEHIESIVTSITERRKEHKHQQSSGGERR